MTTEEKSTYLRIALALQSVVASKEVCYRIVKTLEEIEKKKGKFSLTDAVDLEFELAKREKELEVKAMEKQPNKP